MRDAVWLGDHSADLRAILNKGCALAMWRRVLPVPLAEAVTRLDLDAVDDIDAIVGHTSALPDIAGLLDIAGYRDDTAAHLAADIALMVDCLARIAGADRLRVRFEVVETDACRRFHVDRVTMRLLTTLRGPGTQWIAATAPDAIQQMPTGAVAIFKGQLLAPDPAVLHRSPPLSGTGLARLMLAIDPA